MRVFTTGILVLVLAAFVSGCAMLAERDARLELATKYATAKVISETDVTAQQVVERVQVVRALVDTDAKVTVRDLSAQVRQSINWGSLDAADQMLLEAVLMEAERTLAEVVGDGVLTQQGRVAVGVLLDWIEEAAGRVGDG